MTDEKKYDVEATASAVMSVVRRGDLSALSPEEKTRYLIALCESLGLNPMTNPIQFLRFQGKEIAYVTRGATDQLAARAGLSRSILEGPDVRDFGGKKLVYCKAEGRLPSGRTDTSIATLSAAIDENVLMKAESKAKRRVTLSILGLGMLTEDEADDMDAGQQAQAAGRKPVAKRRATNAEFALVFGASVTRDETMAEYLDTAVAVLREEFGEQPDRLAGELAVLFARHEKLPPIDADALFARLKEAAKLHGAATAFQRAVSDRVSAEAAAVRAEASGAPAAPPAPAMASLAPAPAPAPPPAPPQTADDLSSRRLLEDLAEAENHLMIAAILLDGVPADAPLEQKKVFFAAGCKRLAALREEAGLPTDAASVTAALRETIEAQRKKLSTPKPVEPFAGAGRDASAAWAEYLESKGDDDGAVAGAFAKRAAAFAVTGVQDERLDQTIARVSEIRQKGRQDAATFVRDIAKNNGKRASSASPAT